MNQEKHIREFSRDLREALETRWLGSRYIIRAGMKRRGGIRIIIFNPKHSIPANRTKVFRAYRMDRAIERAVREAFGYNGLNYFIEYKEKGVSRMAVRKLKKVAKKKKGATGVRRKHIAETTDPICAFGEPEKILCKQILKTKREFQAGLCEAHILIEAENKKEAAKTNRQNAKKEREEKDMAKKLTKKGGAKKVTKKATKKGAVKKTATKKSAKKTTKKSGAAADGSNRGGGARILIMDQYPATTFIRTLAKGGLDFTQINKAIKSVLKKGAQMPAEGTIRIQSSKGKRGDGDTISGDGAVTKLIKEFKNK